MTLETLTAAGVRALSTAAIAALNGDQIANLTSTQVGAWAPQVGVLSTDQVSAVENPRHHGLGTAAVRAH